jgi:hypothetical protein
VAILVVCVALAAASRAALLRTLLFAASNFGEGFKKPVFLLIGRLLIDLTWGNLGCILLPV